MNPDLLIDDSEFATPLYLPVAVVVQKFQEAQHRRDRLGRFAEMAQITVGGRPIDVVKPERAVRAGDKLVPLNVVAFDAEFSRDPGFYLGVGGHGGIGDRYQRFGAFIAGHDTIEAPEVHVHDDGRVGFINGRHRYAWLRDQGLTSIPAAMSPESVKNARMHGYLAAVKVAWDESSGQRDSARSPEASAQFGGTVDALFREDPHTIPPTIFRPTATGTSRAPEVDPVQKYDPNQPRDANGRFTDLGLHAGQVTVLHGTTRQNAEAILHEGFKPGNPARVAAQVEREYGLPEGSILRHPAFEFARGRRDLGKVHFTTDESVADQYSVPEVMQDALMAAHQLLHPTPEDTPFTKEMHAARKAWIDTEARRLTEPALLAVTVPFEVVGQHGFGKQFTLDEFKDLLTKFPNAESNIFNNITIPIEALAGARIERRKWETQKQEHTYGNTQIQIDPHSSAASSLNWARHNIDDQDLMGTGKDVDPNHVTVRFGLLDEDLDALRAYIAKQQPFEARVVGVELFPASEHSDGAVPVVARIASPELRRIEDEIGQYAAFKDKNFPEYKPHSTLAYCKPEVAPRYADLWVDGTFLVHDIMISHASGVKETIPFGMPQRWMVRKRSAGLQNHPHWQEAKHPRQPKGSSRGGEFTESLYGPRDAMESLLNGEKHVSIQQGDVRAFLELAAQEPEGVDPDLTDVQVEGHTIFGGNGLGIERDDMPQIPPEHRKAFLKYARSQGVTITHEDVDALTLKPTQNQISARRAGLKLKKYEKGDKKFPAVLVSNENRILDGHHHWGMMAAFTLEIPDATMPIYRLHTTTKQALALMHAYMKLHDLKRASLSGAVVKWDEVQHPRDKEGQFTEREAFIQSAIQRGQPQLVSENEFLAYHYTGHIPSDAYEKYEAGDMEYIHRKDFQTLLDTREVNGQTVEIRLQTETPTYHKWRPEAPKAERDRFYEEYEQEAKRLGTSPMMAGIDLGHDSDAYKALDVFAQRWLATGEGWERDAHGNLIPLTPEEAKAQGKPTETYTVAAFVGDKAVGYAGDEFGASGVYLAREYQKHGLGLMLFKTYLEKSGRLASGRQIGQMTSSGEVLVRALHRQLVKEAKVRKADSAGRYVTPFVSFDKQGDDQLRMIASLNSSRLATWGFTAEAEVLGYARYKLTAVLDGRTSEFCRMIDGKVFDVPDARRKVIEALNVQNPEDLRVVQPWPKQSKAAMAEYRKMTPSELTERGLHIPPFHPYCRTLLRHLKSSAGAGKLKETVPTIPEEAEVFQLVTAEDLAELGIEATPEEVAQWNEHIGMSPVELLSKMTDMSPQEVMTKPLGVGANPIQIDETGAIGINARGESEGGVEFKLGAILDPFTSIFYLTQADLLKGTPKAELAFMKNLFTELINTGLNSSATSLAVGVAGNAVAYAQMGFLPDDLEWDTLRSYALEGDTMLPEILASLAPEDALLVQHLLQDTSVGAMSALVDLPFTYQGKTIGEWLFGEAEGTWALDLTDDLMVAQAKAYLS